MVILAGSCPVGSQASGALGASEKGHYVDCALGAACPCNHPECLKSVLGGALDQTGRSERI